MNSSRVRVLACLTASWILCLTSAGETVPFSQLYELVRTNVVGISSERLNELAVEGFLQRLGGAARFARTESALETSEKSVAKAVVLDGRYGYVRLGEIETNTASEFAAKLSDWQSVHPLDGFVLDLRFASGRDFKGAAQVADQFFPEGQPVLDWGDGPFTSTPKKSSPVAPLTVLVNHDTRGAAEAIAAALRSAGLALILGGTTAGEAAVHRDYLLADGQTLRIAVGSILTGSGLAIPTDGIVPDIAVSPPPAWERSYLSDPYTGITSSTNSPTATNSVVSTVRVRKRVNEAELVRSKQTATDAVPEVVRGPAPSEPVRVIRDPVLARAVDLLKGLNIVRRPEPASK